MRTVDGRVRTAQVLDAAITKVKVADEVVEKLQLSAQVPASDVFKWIADGAYTIVQVTFHNLGGAGYTVPGNITNAGQTVVSSSANLAADAVEEKEGGALSNTAVADGNEVRMVAGDQLSFITVTMTRKVNV